MIDLYEHRNLIRGTRYQHNGGVFRKTSEYMQANYPEVLHACLQISYGAFLVESRAVGGTALGPIKQLMIMYELDHESILNILMEDAGYSEILKGEMSK